MKIIKKETLSELNGTKVTKIEITSPDVAKKAKPGQFVIIMVTKEGERIPLTVATKDLEKGTVTIIFQEVGFTTKLLGSLKEGDDIFAVVGPLGHPTEIKNYGKVIIIGGGVGIAEIYPLTKALKEAGSNVTTIIGARTKDLLILENELKETSNEFLVATDDGSSGKKGFTTDILKSLIEKDKYALVYAVGPKIGRASCRERV